MVTSLLQGGADMEQEDREDLTALHWASRLGQEGVVLVLLDHAADVEVRSALLKLTFPPLALQNGVAAASAPLFSRSHLCAQQSRGPVLQLCTHSAVRRGVFFVFFVPDCRP